MPAHHFKLLLAACLTVPLALSAQTADSPEQPAVTIPDTMRLVLALRDHDCMVSSDNDMDVLATSGLEQGVASDAIVLLLAEGLVTLDPSGAEVVHLVPALCDPAGLGDMRVTLTALIRANGCIMSEDQGLAQFDLLALTRDMTDDTFLAMVEAGEAVIDGSDAMLASALCDGVSLLPSPRGAMMRAMGAADCAMTYDDLLAAMATEGLDTDPFEDLVDLFVEEGSLTAEGDLLRLDARQCAMAAGPGPGAPDPADGPQDPAAGPGPDDAAAPDPLSRVVAALRDSGCSATEDELQPLLDAIEADTPREVLDLAESQAEAMMDMGDILEVGDSLTLSDALCAGEPGRLAAASEELVQAARDADCVIGFDAAVAALEARGFTQEDVEIAGEWMMDAGLATNLGDDLLGLPDEVCRTSDLVEVPELDDVPPAGPDQADAVPGPMAMSPAESAFLIDGILRRAGCVVDIPDQAALDAMLTQPLAAALGMAFPTSDPVVDQSLRALVVQGLTELADAGRAEWMPKWPLARLMTCY